MVNIKTMSLNEIKQAMNLTARENWGYSQDDFKRMLHYEPQGCFIALKDNRAIGLTTTINYGVLGWIGNAVVDETYRNKGLGKQLVVHALGYLKSTGVRCIKLFSYLNFFDFYLQLGFKKEGYCSVFTNSKPLNSARLIYKKNKKATIKRIQSDNLNEIKSLDRRIYGYDRSKLLERFVRDFPQLCNFVSNSSIDGYIMASNSHEIGELGPWICSPTIEKEYARSLLCVSLSEMKVHKLEIVVPEENKIAIEILNDLEFESKYKVAIMHFGESIEFSEPKGILAFCSLAHG